MNLYTFIRDVPDFPQPGIVFKDITPLLANRAAFGHATSAMAGLVSESAELVLGPESRGFIFGTPVAHHLGCGFVPVRKPGKLPAATVAVDYALEYGQASLEMHADALAPGQRVLLVDDVLATGGTAQAVAQLIQSRGAILVAAVFLIELQALQGRDKLAVPVHSLLQY